MKRILCVANWSEGRNVATYELIGSAIHRHADSPPTQVPPVSGRDEPIPGVTLHYLAADFDHNRTVTAFSGSPEAVRGTLFEVCATALAEIDLRRHEGVHPRMGALDVCPFVVLGDSMSERSAVGFSCKVGRELAQRYDLPVFLYEKSETGKHAKDLPALRKGGFEALPDKRLDPDYGPNRTHPRLGATVLGVRDWLLAINVNLADTDPAIAEQVAHKIRELRKTDPRFTGVRALGFSLPSRSRSQVSMNLTRPDETPVDAIVEWVEREAKSIGSRVTETELIGVIRRRDVATATRVPVQPAQIIEE